MKHASGTVSEIIANRSISPLRYPGGKRWILPFLIRLLEATGGRRKLFVEPFVGGGSVTMGLLESGYAENAVINDLDPLVAAFWSVVFSKDVDALVDRVRTARVTLDEWNTLKAQDDDCGTDVDRAFRCLFLNRTSFSGIINRTAGPIGGNAQSGEYGVGCRFNLPRIASRISELGRLRDRVLIRGCGTWQGMADRIDMEIVPGSGFRPDDVFWYLDPPFYHKADRLYRRWFETSDHDELHRFLGMTIYGHWLLSYDSAPEIERLYGGHPGYATMDVGHGYNASALPRNADGKRGRGKTTEIVVSDLLARLRREKKPEWSCGTFRPSDDEADAEGRRDGIVPPVRARADGR